MARTHTTSSPKPTTAGSMIRDTQWGIDNTLSGFIVQSEDIGTEDICDTTKDQKGAVVSQLSYDTHYSLSLNVIGSGTLPDIGDEAFNYAGHKWKVTGTTYNGAFEDKKKYTITAERWEFYPAQ